MHINAAGEYEIESDREDQGVYDDMPTLLTVENMMNHSRKK